MSHRIVNETDMRAPARLTAIDRRQFSLPRSIGPQRAKVVIVITERCKSLPELTRAHVAVVVDHRDCLSRGAGKRPGRGLREIHILRSVMRGNRSDVGDTLDEALCC